MKKKEKQCCQTSGWIERGVHLMVMRMFWETSQADIKGNRMLSYKRGLKGNPRYKYQATPQCKTVHNNIDMPLPLA
jgi:hypothetical protein